jgi:hypothetical protein
MQDERATPPGVQPRRLTSKDPPLWPARPPACRPAKPSKAAGSGGAAAASRYAIPPATCYLLLMLVLGLLGLYVVHCIHASADMYSSPSIVLQTPKQ